MPLLELVHLMNCRLPAAHPLPAPMLIRQVDPNEYISRKFHVKFEKLFIKEHAFENVAGNYVGHFVQTSMRYTTNQIN